MEVKVVHGEQGLEEGERRVAHADDDDARVVDDLGLRDELTRQEEERACLGVKGRGRVGVRVGVGFRVGVWVRG